MIIPTTTGKPDTVEIFQDLDRQLAANIQPVAEIGCTGRASFLIQLADQVGKRNNAIVTVITIFHDRDDKPLLSRMPQYLAHHLLVSVRLAGQVANPPWLIAKQ